MWGCEKREDGLKRAQQIPADKWLIWTAIMREWAIQESVLVAGSCQREDLKNVTTKCGVQDLVFKDDHHDSEHCAVMSFKASQHISKLNAITDTAYKHILYSQTVVWTPEHHMLTPCIPSSNCCHEFGSTHFSRMTLSATALRFLVTGAKWPKPVSPVSSASSMVCQG